jgi:hypothetical protein
MTMSNPVEHAAFPSTSRKYELSEGGYGVQKLFAPSGYILAEQYGNRPDFSVVWSTDMGPREVLEKTADMRPLRKGLDARGFIIRNDDEPPLYTTASAVIRMVEEAPDDIVTFKAGTLSAVSLQWHQARNQSADYDGNYGEIGGNGGNASASCHRAYYCGNGY